MRGFWYEIFQLLCHESLKQETNSRKRLSQLYQARKAAHIELTTPFHPQTPLLLPVLIQTIPLT